MIRMLTVALSATTSLAAAFVAVHSLFLDADGRPGWVAVKVLQSLAVMAVGALTIRRCLRPEGGGAALVLLGAIWLQVSGGAGFAWTLHLGEVTGDFEAWALALTAAIAGQGALVTWSLWRAGSRPA